jgi:hypothetical protein
LTRATTGTIGVVLAVAIVSIACIDQEDTPRPAEVERTVELGPIDAPTVPAWLAPVLRAELDPRGLGWITGMEASAPPGVRVTDAGITLDLEIDVVRVSDDAPALALPPGLGVPVLGIRGDLPEGWRAIRATARAVAVERPIGDVSIRVHLTGIAPVDYGTMTPVWRVPIALDDPGPTPATSERTTTVSVDLGRRLPAPGRVHALVPRTHGSAREIRLVSDPEATVLARLSREERGDPLGAWSDPEGIAVRPDRQVRLEIDMTPVDAPDDPPAVDVYLRADDGYALEYSIRSPVR